jgi:hypothetical protein
MQIQRTSMPQAVEAGAQGPRPATTPSPQPASAHPSAVPTSAPKQPQPAQTEDAQKPRKADPSIPPLSSGDRAAIASSTGFYISPSGEVTPEGMPPWSFIMQTLEKRHKVDAPNEPAVPAPAAASDGVDVTV